MLMESELVRLPGPLGKRLGSQGLGIVFSAFRHGRSTRRVREPFRKRLGCKSLGIVTSVFRKMYALHIYTNV